MEDVYTITVYILLGAFLGVVGQSARVIVGLKKRSDEASLQGKEMKDWFDSKTLIISLIIGAFAGSLGAISLLDKEIIINKEYLLTLIAIGYAGTDFIEGFMKTRLPQSSTATADHNNNNVTR